MPLRAHAEESLSRSFAEHDSWLMQHLDTLATHLDRAKWHLWHSDVFPALQIVEWLQDNIKAAAISTPATGKLVKAMREIDENIAGNFAFVPYYYRVAIGMAKPS
jgi:predicted transcriptional regulator